MYFQSFFRVPIFSQNNILHPLKIPFPFPPSSNAPLSSSPPSSSWREWPAWRSRRRTPTPSPRQRPRQRPTTLLLLGPPLPPTLPSSQSIPGPTTLPRGHTRPRLRPTPSSIPLRTLRTRRIHPTLLHHLTPITLSTRPTPLLLPPHTTRRSAPQRSGAPRLSCACPTWCRAAKTWT